MKLRTQLGLLLVILAVVLSGIMFAGFQLNKESVVDQQRASVTHTSEEIAEGLDGRLDTLERTVRLRATNPAIAAHGTPRQHRALQTTVNETDFNGVSVIHRNGTMTGIAADLDAITRARLVGSDFSDRRYFQQARHGETYVSAPVAADSGNYIVTISTPIYQNGTVVGTLNAALHLQNSSFFTGVTSAAASHQGIVIQSESGEVIYEQSPDPATNLIIANTTVQETGWTVRTKASREVLAGELRMVTKCQVSAIGLVLLLVGGFGVLLYTRTLRYHDRLLDGFDILQREDYGAQLDVDATDDWERVFTAFNDMSRTLATYETERTEHREQLQRERDRFRTLFQGIPEPVVIIEFTEDGTILQDVNEAFEETFGYEAADAIGSEINELIVPDDEMDTARAIDERAASGEHLTREVRRETTDGVRDFLFRSTPVVSERVVDKQFGVYIDITERKQHEQRLNRLHDATRNLMQAEDHESIAEMAVETARDVLDMPINGLWLHDEAANILRPTATTDAARDLLGELPVFEPGSSLSWDAFQAQEAKLVEDVTAQPRRANPETALRSEIILPLGDQGVMNIGATERAAFDEADRSLARILAANVEAALTRADRQQALARQTERLDLALEGGQLGVWDWNVQTDAVTFDERWADMLGYSPDEIEPYLSAWEKRAHPEDLPDTEAALEAHFAGETEYYQCDHRIQTRSGDWIWVRATGKVVERDDDGEPVRAVGIHQDITKQKERERKLRETLEQTRALIEAETASEAATIAVEIADQTLSFPLSGVHLEQDDERLEPAAVTDALREHLGFAPTYERTGGERRVHELVWDVYASGDTRHITNIEQELPEIAGETPSQSTIIHPLENHGVFITSSNSPDAFDEFDQYLVGLLAAILASTLERLHQEQQIESQRDNLDVLNQMVRHDIRNDLQVLLARLDLLAEHVDEAGADHIESALISAHNAVELTQTARDMSEVLLQDGTDCQPIVLRSVIQCQLDEVREMDPQASITIDGSIPEVTISANDMFDSVVRNLLKNAVQHTDKEFPEVVISATEQDDSVLLRVADNGPGVPDEQKDAIFGKGEKGLDSTGTGIGLYLVHTLVESYGGAVWVEDNDPEGAVFTVELPKEEWGPDY
ncbi:MAG: PAS domain-containing protein [Haloarcula sp.]